MAYTIEILGVNKTSLLKAGSLRVTRRTDKNNDCSLVLITTASGYLPIVGQDIKVKNSGTVIFGGCIKTITSRKIGAGYGNTTKIEIEISSDGYRSIPARRTITNSYDQQSAGAIVTDLVTNVFDSEGITAGTIGTGANPVGDAGEYDAICKNCAEILDDMAQASGYKWYIDDTKKLYFVADDTVSAAAHDIVEGGVFTDYEIESYETTLDQYANKIFVRGGLGDDGNAIQTFQQDTAEQSARQTVEGGAGYSTGVYGTVINDTNIDVLADAATAAANALKKSGIIPSVLNITSHTLDWAPGTKVKINLPTFGISTDTYYLIEELTLEDIDGKNLVCMFKASIRKTLDFSSQSSQSGIDYLGNVVKAAKDAGNKIISANSNIYFESATNTSLITINNSAETVVCTKDITFPARSKIIINFSCTILTSGGALNATAKTFVNGMALTMQPKAFQGSANSLVFTFMDEKKDVSAGTKTIAVKIVTDANSGTIAIGQSKMIVQVFVDPMPGLNDPTNFTASVISATQINLAWTNPS